MNAWSVLEAMWRGEASRPQSGERRNAQAFNMVNIQYIYQDLNAFRTYMNNLFRTNHTYVHTLQY